MNGMGSVERVLVLGIVVVIVAILGIAIWGATGDTPAVAMDAATDGGAATVPPAVVPLPTQGAAPEIGRPVAAGGERTPVSEIERWRQLREQERAARNAEAAGGAAAPLAGGPAPAVTTELPGAAPAAGLVGEVGAVALKNGVEHGAAPAAGAQVPWTPMLPGVGVGPAAGGAPATPEAVKPAAPAGPKSYTVAEGDSLWRIAVKEYGNSDIQQSIDRILAANPSVEADRLKIGTKLVIPGKTGGTDASRLPAAEQVKVLDGKLYTVKDGDTLSDIARKQLGSTKRWNEIYELNRERISDPSRLYVGTTLRLPKN